jgi:hypothetical protein
MAATMLPEDHECSDGMTLVDIIAFFAENLWFLLRGLAAGFVAGVLYVGLMPQSFKASAQIQMATANGVSIEIPAVLVEKIKVPQYFSEQTQLACGVDHKLYPSRTMAKQLQPTLNRNGAFVSISFIADSPGGATACLSAVIKEIQSMQAELADPIIEFAEANLQSLKNKQAQKEEHVQSLQKIMTRAHLSDPKSPGLAYMASMLALSDQAELELQLKISEAEIKLAAPNTQATAIIGGIFAPDTPDGPGWWLILVLASLSGLLIATAFLLIRKGLQKRTTQAASVI